MRLLDAPQNALAIVDVTPSEVSGAVDPRGLLDRLERAREPRLELEGRRGDSKDVVERDCARAREFAARRHQGVEHQRQEVALRGERHPFHARLRIIPSAM